METDYNTGWRAGQIGTSWGSTRENAEKWYTHRLEADHLCREMNYVE